MSFGWALCHLKYNWTHSIEEERRASGQLVAVVSEENDRGQRPHLRSLLDDLDTVGFSTSAVCLFIIWSLRYPRLILNSISS